MPALIRGETGTSKTCGAFPAYRGKRCRWLFALALLVCLASSAARTSDQEWNLQKSHDGVQVFLRDYPGSTIPEFKAVTRIPSSMASILAVLLDIPGYREWVHYCQRSFALGAGEQYVYQATQLPFARDRDIILRASVSHRHQGREVVIRLRAAPEYCQRNDDPGCDRTRSGRYLRITEAIGSYRLEQLDKTTVKLVWQQHVDPGGKLPDWLVRTFLTSIPYNTLVNIREVAQQPRYRNRKLLIEDGSLRVLDTAGDDS